MLREPAPGTVERWAWDFALATSLAGKLSPRPPPERWETEDGAQEPLAPCVLRAPGRPPELRVIARAPKSPGLSTPAGRARALHTFLHHELQAAECMAWALLAFPAAPRELRAGLVRIALDETRHMRLYAAEIERLGHHVGDFPVRDWFWERIPSCEGVVSFLATMGLGLESANLEHTASFAARFRDAGDEEGARVQELVGREEIAHVRFGARWFVELAGELDFDRWRRALVPPLSPMLMRGRPLQRDARLLAGQPAMFVDRLDAWQADAPGS